MLATEHRAHAGPVGPKLWAQEADLNETPGTQSDGFGVVVSLSGNTALIGASAKTIGAHVRQGAAEVFVRTGAPWTLQTELVPDDGADDDHFGNAVSLSGDTALIGSDQKQVGGNDRQGEGYVYVRTGSTWLSQAHLIAADGKASDHFGESVSVSGDTALIGAPGKGTAYVFVRTGTTWTQQAQLVTSGAGRIEYFGNSVALSGDTALIGAYNDPRVGNIRQGAAYVFVRSGTTWTEQATLTASNGTTNDYFGTAVSIDGDTAVIGAITFSTAYVFVRVGTTWTEQGKLAAPDGVQDSCFGIAVSVSGEHALVGDVCNGGAGVAYHGAAYVFSRTGSTWAAQSGPFYGDGANGTDASNVGSSVSLSGQAGLVGAPAERVGGVPQTGAAYVFSYASAVGSTCSASSDCADGNCVDGFCCDQACIGGCAACSVAQGATQDATCTILPAGAHTCGAQICDGKSAACKPCAADANCPSGHCVDSVCCDTTCAGTCEACTRALTDEPDGTCSPIPADRDPRDECEAASNCGSTGQCDGKRACQTFAKVGTACGPSTCVDGTVTGRICDGAGQCQERGLASCAPFTCGADACVAHCSTDDECTPSAHCARGTCVERKLRGDRCSTANECATGFCADDVCCDGSCTGQCQACNEPNQAGVCVMVLGAPRGGRAACKGDPSVCGGQCDRVSADQCHYPAAATPCGNRGAVGGVSASTCDGAGECIEQSAGSCAPYAGGATECPAVCASQADCAADFACTDAHCVAADTPAAQPTGDLSSRSCGCRLASAATPKATDLLWLALMGSVLAGRRARAQRSVGSRRSTAGLTK
jgi:hypothetical protein